MKTQTLCSIAIIVLIALTTSCKSSQIAIEEIDNTNEYVWETGTIIWEPFVNKIGEVIPEYGDYYFVCMDGEYFIKLMDCKKINVDLKDYKNNYIRMRICMHDGLWDTNDPNVQSRVGQYITFDSIVKIDEPTKIVYNDGNANAYIITPEQFKYNPNTPMESSSGTYSGGDPKDFTIDNNQFHNIFVRAEKVITTEDIIIETRQMGTGFIKIIFKDSEMKAYIANSSDLADFESYLKEMMLGK